MADSQMFPELSRALEGVKINTSTAFGIVADQGKMPHGLSFWFAGITAAGTAVVVFFSRDPGEALVATPPATINSGRKPLPPPAPEIYLDSQTAFEQVFAM